RSAAYPTRERYFFYNYKVVGVIKADATDWAIGASLAYSGIPRHYMSNMMFLTTASLLAEGGAALDPTFSLVQETNEEFGYTETYALATYGADDADALNEEYICLGANAFQTKGSVHIDFGGGETALPYSRIRIFADPENYAGLKAAATFLNAGLTDIFGDNTSKYVAANFISEIYGSIDMMYTVFTYMILFMAVIGGVIFFAAMVNLFNSIVHSVDSRKGYLGVLRAIGAKRRLINLMYFAESLTIFGRASIWIISFAGAICIAIKILLDYLFRGIGNIFPFSLGIGWQYVFWAVGVCLGVLLLLGFLFSFGCSWKVARAKITETLAG
ncbi:MAG: hypothetical protein LBL66_08830, partial [Clostridiales bacterium]|nr:hypothetical protein [Clostridiales bacterium]